MFRGAFVVSVLVIFCSVILFPAISISSVPAIIGQDDEGTGNSPVGFNAGENSKMSQGHQVHVNVTTGNAVVKHMDLVIPTRGKDIVISRTYNSFQHITGIEEGLYIYHNNSGYWEAFTVTKGVAWINGERVVLENDASWVPDFQNDSYYTHYFYIHNIGNNIGEIIVNGTVPGDAPTDYHYIGLATMNYENEAGVDVDYVFNSGSLKTGKIMGCDVTIWAEDGDIIFYKVENGLVAIRDNIYKVNQETISYQSAGRPNQEFLVLSPPTSGNIANYDLLFSPPNESNYPDGFLVIDIGRNQPYGRFYIPAVLHEPKLGTKGKWRFGFEGYASHTLTNGVSSTYDHDIIYSNGADAKSEIHQRRGLPAHNFIDNTTKRKYLTSTHVVGSGGPFAVGTFSAAGNVITEESFFELRTLDDYVKIYRGIRLYRNGQPVNQDPESIRDDAVLTEEVDSNGNRLVYDWVDGPNGAFRGIDGTSLERDYRINRIYDDNNGDSIPDSVIVRFSYADSNHPSYITSIVVTDGTGSNPEVVADYIYDTNGNLTEYVDFHGRHFTYEY